jgi:hypothetical protein
MAIKIQPPARDLDPSKLDKFLGDGVADKTVTAHGAETVMDGPMKKEPNESRGGGRATSRSRNDDADAVNNDGKPDRRKRNRIRKNEIRANVAMEMETNIALSGMAKMAGTTLNDYIEDVLIDHIKKTRP